MILPSNTTTEARRVRAALETITPVVTLVVNKVNAHTYRGLARITSQARRVAFVVTANTGAIEVDFFGTRKTLYSWPALGELDPSRQPQAPVPLDVPAPNGADRD